MGRACGQEKEPATVWTFAAGGAVTLGDRKGPGTVQQSPVPEAALAGHETCQDPEGTTWSEPASLPVPETTDTPLGAQLGASWRGAGLRRWLTV